ncbi:hypothetical protein BKA80DRAFT_147261 [Phyllosticta citrichinensis]
MSDTSDAAEQLDPTQRPGAWDYLLFSELINLCLYFPALAGLKYIPPDEEVPPSADRFLFHDEQDAILKIKSDSWFMDVGLWTPADAHDCSQAGDMDNEVDDTYDCSQPGHVGELDGAHESSQAGAIDKEDDAADDCSQVGSEWATASNAASSSFFGAPSSAAALALPDAASTALHWHAITAHAAHLRAVYARNLPSGLSALPLAGWSAADVLRAALVGVFRVFSRIARYLSAIFDAADWSGAMLAVMVRRARATTCQEHSNAAAGAKALAESTLGRVLVLCCPWREDEMKRGWVAVVVGWIGALADHQRQFEEQDEGQEEDAAAEDKDLDEEGGLEKGDAAVDESEYFSCEG